MASLTSLLAFSRRPAARRSGRRSASTRLGGLERLEAKTPLTVEASLSGGLLTLNYLYPTDAAVLAFGSDGTFAVTGDVSGTTSGASAEVTQIFVMNLGNLEGIPFEYDSTQFTITGSATVAAGLIIGDFAGANGGIQTVTLSVPGFATNGGDFSVVGGTLTIAGQIDTSGASGLAGGGIAGDVTIMALSGGISLPSAIIATGGDGSAGGGSGGGVALVASGAIAVDGAIEASGGSGGTDGGNGGAVKITAGTSVVVSGAIETYGTGGGTVGGSGGAVTITAGTSAAVGGDIETYGGSGGTAGGSGGAVTITAGQAISTEAINAAAGGRYATAGVVTIDQDDPGVTSAFASSAIRAAARPSGRVAVGRITGGDVSIKSVTGAIYLVGDLVINGDGTCDGPVELGRQIRVDSSFEAGDVTFTSTVDGRHPLVVAAGAGAVSFQGAVGATRPLAGLRLESAGSVTAAGRVHVAGGVAGALRHGIEIAPAAQNVNLAQGGSIRGFRSGQAIHAPGGSEGSTISGFRIANSGRPFVGYSAAGGATLGNNQIVSPVVRPATARITTPAGRTNDSTPTLSGTARSVDIVTLYADDVPVGSTVAANGRWTITAAAVADGRRSFAVRAVGPAGIAAEFSKPVILSIKTTPPVAPTVGLAAASDSGILGDMTTTDTRPVLAGTSAPGTRVQVAIDGRVRGTVTATPRGTWRLPVTAGIPGGVDRVSRTISVTATDPFGNASATAATLVTLLIDDSVLTVAVPAAQAGSLTQYLLARDVPPGPSLAPVACAPTSATNALVYLQRQYPSLFRVDLAGRTLADWAATATALAGPGFMNTQPELGGTVPAGNLPAGLRALIASRGYGGAIDVSGMFPQGEHGGFVETHVGPLPEGYTAGVPTPLFIADALADGHPVIVTIIYPPEAGRQVSGHNVLVTGMTWDETTDTGAFTFIDPLDAAGAVRRGGQGLLPVGPQKLTSGTVSITPTLPLPVVNGIQDVVRDVLTLRYDQYQGQLPYQPTGYGQTIAFIAGATVLRPTAQALAARVTVQVDIGVRRGVPVVMTHAQLARASVGTVVAQSFVVTSTSSGRLERLDGQRWVALPRGDLSVAHSDIARLAAQREIRPGDTVRWIPAAPSPGRPVAAFRIHAWNGAALSATSSLVTVVPGGRGGIPPE